MFKRFLSLAVFGAFLLVGAPAIAMPPGGGAGQLTIEQEQAQFDAEFFRLSQVHDELQKELAALNAANPNAETEGLSPEAAQAFRALFERMKEFQAQVEDWSARHDAFLERTE